MSLSLDEVRKQFPSLESRVWMQHGGGASPPLCVGEAYARVGRLITGDCMVWPEAYASDRQELREIVGRLIGCAPGDVTLVRSTAAGLSLLTTGLDWQPGDNIVSARWEFPSNLLPWMSLADRGVELRMAEPVDGRVTPEALLDLADDRTRVIAVSHVQFWNGYRVDIAGLGDACRARGIITAVDAIQAAGAVPLDVGAVDLVSAGAVKWLLGGLGIGFCYVHPDLARRLRPAAVGLGGMADQSAIFSPDLDPVPSARRFEESATSWPAIAGMLAALQLLEDFGFDNVHQRVVGTTQRIGKELSDRGWQVVEPWPRADAEASGLLSFRHPRGGDPEEVVARVDAAGIFIRSYRDFVRVSPHFYNSDEEIDRLLEAIGAP